MEDLTKQQIVLVTLLVSFVTSIATGIVTVSLMDQAPPAVTQTINRVVERTVERVVPQESQGAIVKETVIIPEEDLIVKAVEKIMPSIVHIKALRRGERAYDFAGLGLVLTSSGLLITDGSVVSPNAKYIGVLHDGSEVVLERIDDIRNESNATFFKFNLPENKELIPLEQADSDKVKLGQHIVTVSGNDKMSVYEGIIERLDEPISSKTNPEIPHNYSLISTNIDGKMLYSGSPLINLDGEVIGIQISDSQPLRLGDFVPINLLTATIEAHIQSIGK